MKLFLDAGYSLADSLEVITGFESLNVFLKQGGALQKWLYDNDYSLLASLLEKMEFKLALKIYLNLENFKKEHLKKLKLVLVLPCIYLVMAIALACLAEFWLLPILESLLGAGRVVFALWVLKAINIGLLTCLLVIVVLVVLLIFQERSFWVLLLNKPYFKWLHKLFVYRFVNYYLAFADNISESILVIKGLRNLKSEFVVRNYADLVHYQLNSGQDLIQSFNIIDKDLSVMLMIGTKTMNVSKILKIYLQKIELEINKIIKGIGIFLQVFSYGYIAILVIVIYQMLLLPLEMIERI
ncbi:MAG: hypothetical protein ACK5G7_06120 [Erysipelotrichaceae bacterium]